MSESKSDSEMLHEALELILRQSAKIDGQLGSISLEIRYDSRVGRQVHVAATVRHRLIVTEQEKDVE
jgi:hypothetical protein